MKINLNISDELLLNYAERSTINCVLPENLEEDELIPYKINFALQDITAKVRNLVMRPAEIDLKKKHKQILETEVETLRKQIESGATVSVAE